MVVIWLDCLQDQQSGNLILYLLIWIYEKCHSLINIMSKCKQFEVVTICPFKCTFLFLTHLEELFIKIRILIAFVCKWGVHSIRHWPWMGYQLKLIANISRTIKFIQNYFSKGKLTIKHHMTLKFDYMIFFWTFPQYKLIIFGFFIQLILWLY